MIVFDTWALMAFFQGEPAAQKVKSIIEGSWAKNQDMRISAINLGEIWYNLARRQGDEKADDVVEKIRLIGIKVEETTQSRIFNAARMKKNGRISYADAFAAALALESNATLITGDLEFKDLENVIRIDWLPRP